MNKEISKLVFPNKKINFFTFSILLLGFICGCIFLVMLSKDDKTSVIEQIVNYFTLVNNGDIDSGLAFKNSLIINLIYVFGIWLLGLSIIGIVLNVFIIYVKGFVVGFVLSAIFITYSLKGILSSFLYLLLGQLFNIIIIFVVGIYSFMFSINLIKLIFNKRRDCDKKLMKKYFIILIFAVILTVISSFFETFLFPNILKLFISFYVK